jgi:hypothetical protein
MVVSSHHSAMPPARTYRFTITTAVEPHQKGFDDPEWIADAARGALSHEYGYDCTYGDIEELVGTNHSS